MHRGGNYTLGTSWRPVSRSSLCTLTAASIGEDLARLRPQPNLNMRQPRKLPWETGHQAGIERVCARSGYGLTDGDLLFRRRCRPEQ
jgi:hypothetical protein